MSRILNLPNRLTIGIAAIALLAIAATTTTLAARPSQAQGAPVDASCAAQAADTTPETTGAPDTADAAEPAGAADTDTTQTEEGDQTTPDVAGAPATN